MDISIVENLMKIILKEMWFYWIEYKDKNKSRAAIISSFLFEKHHSLIIKFGLIKFTMADKKIKKVAI